MASFSPSAPSPNTSGDDPGASRPSARELNAAWRSDWSAAIKSEFVRAQTAGLDFSHLRLWHQPERGTLRNGVRMARLLAGSLTLPALAAALSPALLFKKTLPWFSRLCASRDLRGPSSSYGVGIMVDTESPGLALLRVGPRSEDNELIVERMREGGLTSAQAREAIAGHELGHLAYMGLMRDEKKRGRVGELAEANGIGRGLIEASRRDPHKLSALARQAIIGTPVLALVAGSALISPMAGLVGVIAASYWSDWRLKKDKRVPQMESSVIFEEGFCDAFAALLPLTGPSPDKELAMARARSFLALRQGLLFGASHGVSAASRAVLNELEAEGVGESGLSLAQVTDIAAAAASAPVGLVWTVSRFKELAELTMDREALLAQAQEHEVEGSEPSQSRRQRVREMLALEKSQKEQESAQEAPAPSPSFKPPKP